MTALKAADAAQAGVILGERAADMAPTAAGAAASPATAASRNHRSGAQRDEPGRVQVVIRRPEALERAQPGTAVTKRGRRVKGAERRPRHAQIVPIALGERPEEHRDAGNLKDRGRVATPGIEGSLVRMHQGRQRKGRVRELGQGAPGGLQAVKIRRRDHGVAASTASELDSTKPRQDTTRVPVSVGATLWNITRSGIERRD